MTNGSMIGGVLIAVTLVLSTLYVGKWFSSAVQFSDAHTLDASRITRPVVCSFSKNDGATQTSGTIHARSGLMRFDITVAQGGESSSWGVEVDMNNDARMMTQAGPKDDYVNIDAYPDLRVQILEDLNDIIESESLHCVPWWSASSFRFNLEGRL